MLSKWACNCPSSPHRRRAPSDALDVATMRDRNFTPERRRRSGLTLEIPERHPRIVENAVLAAYALR
jgi:hypothetical protein